MKTPLLSMTLLALCAGIARAQAPLPTGSAPESPAAAPATPAEAVDVPPIQTWETGAPPAGPQHFDGAPGEPAPVTIMPAPPPAYRPGPLVQPARPQRPLVLGKVEPRRKQRYGDAGAPVAVGIGGDVLFRDEPRSAGESKARGALDVFASYDVWAPARSTFVLAAGLSYRRDERARGASAELREHLLNAELTGRVRALSWLWPHVRAGVGVASTRLEYHDELANVDLSDRSPGVAGTFGAGFTLRTPTRALETYAGRLSSLSLGLMFEGGYTVASDAALHPRAQGRSDIRRVSLGSVEVERSAAYLRILAVVRF